MTIEEQLQHPKIQSKFRSIVDAPRSNINPLSSEMSCVSMSRKSCEKFVPKYLRFDFFLFFFRLFVSFGFCLYSLSLTFREIWRHTYGKILNKQRRKSITYQELTQELQQVYFLTAV
jgi:hypothetical protein